MKDSPSIKKGNYIQAYKCECGHLIPMYMNGFRRVPMPSFAFYYCCPECGRTKEEIKLITGYWEFEKIKHGIWPVRWTSEKKKRFVASKFN